MNIIIERLQKVIELHEEMEKKNWNYVKEVCAENELGYLEYKTEYINPKGIKYEIVQTVDKKNAYKIIVYQDGKNKRKCIELVHKLLEAEKERQAKWEAEYDARIQEMKEETEETEKVESETRQVKRVSVDNQEEVLKDLMLKVIDRTNKNYSYILHEIEESFFEFDAGMKVVPIYFKNTGIKINADRKMAGFLMNYMSDRITYDMQEKKKGEI